MFDLSEVRVNESFYKEVHRESAIVRDNKSLSYPVSELPGVNCLILLNKLWFKMSLVLPCSLMNCRRRDSFAFWWKITPWSTKL